MIFAGLPDIYECEGYDREDIDMPDSHNALIEAVAKVNPNIIVVLQLGAPVAMPWINLAKAVVVAYLGGQAGGGACVDVLTGRVCPSGKLAESWPLKVEDTPCYRYYPGNSKKTEYRESVLVGYRFYEKAGREVAFPFGHGLSYTSFEYSGLELESPRFEKGKTLSVSLTVKNTGDVDGAEVVQLYIGKKGSELFRPKKELRDFSKVKLAAGESRRITFTLGDRSFAYYNAAKGCWAVEGGLYSVSLGSSSGDIRLEAAIDVEGDGMESGLEYLRQSSPEYFDIGEGIFEVKRSSFEALYGSPVPEGKTQTTGRLHPTAP